MNNLDKEKWKPLFGTWWFKIEKFFDAGGFDPIYAYLKKEGNRGKLICPPSSLTFRCFLETPLDDMKCAMFGLSPYHTMRSNKLIADGLLMGCSTTNSLQPSLLKFYEAIEREMYRDIYHIKNPDVSYLAKQGVLMCNAALTTGFRKAGNHVEIWEPFMKFLFEEIINITAVPVIFLGEKASKMEKYILPLYGTYVFKLAHPASAAYNDGDWSTNGAFKSVNKILKERHGEEIKWLDMPDLF